MIHSTEGTASGRTHGRSIEGRIALVTGAASGIGRASAELLAQAGAEVVAVDRDPACEAVVEAIRSQGGRATFAPCDVEEPAEIERLALDQQKRSGRLDVLVNVVGGAHLKPVIEMDLEWWNAELHFNLTTAFMMCRAFLPGMVQQRSGAIVNISSGWGFRPAPQRAAYSAAKAALQAFSRSLAAEVAEANVRVNIVAAGATDTARMRALTADDNLSQTAQRAIPLGRLARPEDVAAAVLFLASDDSSYMTGQVIHVNGGLFMP